MSTPMATDEERETCREFIGKEVTRLSTQRIELLQQIMQSRDGAEAA